jgi:hypothetical protein
MRSKMRSKMCKRPAHWPHAGPLYFFGIASFQQPAACVAEGLGLVPRGSPNYTS